VPWQTHGGPFGDQSAEAAADRVGFLIREAIGGEPAAEIYRRGEVVSANLNWLALLAKLFSPLSRAHRGRSSEGDAVPSLGKTMAPTPRRSHSRTPRSSRRSSRPR